MVFVSSTHSKAVDPIAFPDGKNKHVPVPPLLTGGDIDGHLHSFKSEMTRTALPLSHEGNDSKPIAAAWFVS